MTPLHFPDEIRKLNFLNNSDLLEKLEQDKNLQGVLIRALESMKVSPLAVEDKILAQRLKIILAGSTRIETKTVKTALKILQIVSGDLSLDAIIKLMEQNHQDALDYIKGNWDNFNSQEKIELLHAAVSQNKNKIVEFLLSKNVDPNGVSLTGDTALHLACIKRLIPLAIMLLNAGANPDLLDSQGRPALHIAYATGNMEMLQELLANRGVDPNVKDQNGDTILMLAFRENKRDLVQVLLQHQFIDPNMTFRNGKTLLQMLIEKNVLSMLGVLLKRKDLEVRDREGRAPLIMLAYQKAKIKENPKILDLVLSHTSISEEDRNGWKLYWAFNHGTASEREALLNRKEINLDLRFEEGKTLLFLSVEHSVNKQWIIKLLKKGADPNIPNNNGKTPLDYAMYAHAKPDIKKALLDNGADPHILLYDKEFSVTRRIPIGHDWNVKETLKFLLELKSVKIIDKNGRVPLATALRHANTGNYELLNLILNHPSLSEADRNGIKLYLAYFKNKTAEVDELLNSKEINVNLVFPDGETIFYLFCQRGDKKRVAILLEKGANPNFIGAYSPLVRVIYSGDIAILDLLLKHKANPVDVNVQNSSGSTPLHCAAEVGNPEIVSRLLRHGANPNIANKRGVTPLLWAASTGNLDIVSRLLRDGANPNIADNRGVTPLLWAALTGNPAVVSRLLRHGANPNIADNWGVTPLHEAYRRNDKSIINILINAGADPTLQDVWGHIPIDCERRTQ